MAGIFLYNERKPSDRSLPFDLHSQKETHERAGHKGAVCTRCRDGREHPRNGDAEPQGDRTGQDEGASTAGDSQYNGGEASAWTSQRGDLNQPSVFSNMDLTQLSRASSQSKRFQPGKIRAHPNTMHMHFELIITIDIFHARVRRKLGSKCDPDA